MSQKKWPQFIEHFLAQAAFFYSLNLRSFPSLLFTHPLYVGQEIIANGTKEILILCLFYVSRERTAHEGDF